MPAIKQALEMTRTARWYREASGAQRATAWAERTRDYDALRAVLAALPADAGAGRRRQPPVELSGLLTLVAKQAYYAGAEPVYRRYRDKQRTQQIPRWAGQDPDIRPAAAFPAEAKIVAFWPYREGVIDVADAFDMTHAEWAACYLRALAAWAADEPALAAYRPAGAPPCALEDMLVLAGAATAAADPARSWSRPDVPAPAYTRAVRLRELADHVVRVVLDDPSITPLGAFNTVRDEVSALLTLPLASPADRLSQALAELSDQLMHADPAADDDGTGQGAPQGAAAGTAEGTGTALTREQADRLRSSLLDLAALLDGFAGRDDDGPPSTEVTEP